MKLAIRVLHLAVAGLSVLAPLTLQADCPFGLSPVRRYGGGANPRMMATGDFNNDGYADVAVIDSSGQTMTIVLSSSGGILRVGSQFTVKHYEDLVAFDVDKDGKIDLVGSQGQFENGFYDPHLEVLRGHGDGTFSVVPFTNLQYIPGPLAMALGDFDKDGLIDIVITKSKDPFYKDKQVAVMKNLGGTFSSLDEKYTLSVTDALTGRIATGDFDGDGNLDFAVTELFSQSPQRHVSLYYGRGNGTFEQSPNPIEFTSSGTYPTDLKAGDFNSDGKDDLAIVISDPHGIVNPPVDVVLSNSVSRTFAAPVGYGHFLTGALLDVADIDGDGKLDLLVSGWPSLSLMRGAGDGTFAPQQAVGDFDVWLAVDDFDGDGGPDIITTGGSNSLSVVLNQCGRIALGVTSSSNPVAQGDPLTVTAKVVSPVATAATGTFTLKRGTTLLKGGNLNAGNTLSETMSDLTPATYVFTAEYSGDSRFVSSIKSIQQIVSDPPFGAPTGLNAISFGGPVQLAWNATTNTDHYEIWRSDGLAWAQAGTSTIAAFSDFAAPASAALLYRVRAFSADSVASPFSASDLALTYTFTDGTLLPHVTPVKRIHLTELRSAADAVRAISGLGAASWAEANPQTVRAAHIVELRTAINEARAALLLPTLTFTDTTLPAGIKGIRAVHFEELRGAMR